MDLFIYEDNKLHLNKPEILLVKEFADLWETSRNRSGEDKGGYNRLRAFKEFTYIYLMYDWESPYKNQSDTERHLSSVEDCQLTQKQMEDEKFKAACAKYRSMQETPQSRLLRSAYKTLDELTLFFSTVDLQERDAEGKFILPHDRVMGSIGKLGVAVAGLDVLEEQVRKQKEANSPKLRGDIEPGAFD